MKRYDYPSKAAEKKLEMIVNRGLRFTRKDIANVTRILEDVRKNGDAALVRYATQYDSPGLTAGSIEVTPDEFDAAKKCVDGKFIRAVNRAADQIAQFHERQMTNSWITMEREGTLLGQLVNPVDRVGIYVPGGTGGKTPLVSSVLMGGIPARIAGVRQIGMVTPAKQDGTVNPYLLYAAKKVGIQAVYRVGSAWAIAALAYGTETIPKVDVIVGPGNIYVTIAKKIVSGTVGIDMVAGPSEILVIADGGSNPEFIAADLLSQAEHDPLASAILITTSKEMAIAVTRAVEVQLETLPRKKIAAASLAAYGAVLVVPDLFAAIEIANRIAPEHLELLIENPFQYIGRIRNAGAVFVGAYTPEPVGDYMAGANHVLPTAGTARFSSALSVDHFIKKTSLIHYEQCALNREAKDILCLAELEGLDAHANSIKIRMK